MLGPNKNIFLYWAGTGNQFCIEPNGGSWWGLERTKIQFKNGQMLSEDCIGKFKMSTVILEN